MHKRATLDAVKRLLHSSAHLERRRGTHRQALAYCTKEESRVEGPWQHGEEPAQGQRNDLKNFTEWIRSEPRSRDDVIDEFPEILAKYPRFVDESFAYVRRRNLKIPEFVAKPGWQTLLAERLAQEPDARSVYWYCGRTGGEGKSYFALNYGGGRKQYVITGGKHADVQYGYLKAGTPKIVFFDWARGGEEAFPYRLLETFKNGYFLNTKYECEPVRFSVPHVIVFANFMPDMQQLSIDRWIIKEIN